MSMILHQSAGRTQVRLLHVPADPDLVAGPTGREGENPSMAIDLAAKSLRLATEAVFDAIA